MKVNINVTFIRYTSISALNWQQPQPQPANQKATLKKPEEVVTKGMSIEEIEFEFRRRVRGMIE